MKAYFWMPGLLIISQICTSDVGPNYSENGTYYILPSIENRYSTYQTLSLIEAVLKKVAQEESTPPIMQKSSLDNDSMKLDQEFISQLNSTFSRVEKLKIEAERQVDLPDPFSFSNFTSELGELINELKALMKLFNKEKYGNEKYLIQLLTLRLQPILPISSMADTTAPQKRIPEPSNLDHNNMLFVIFQVLDKKINSLDNETWEFIFKYLENKDNSKISFQDFNLKMYQQFQKWNELWGMIAGYLVDFSPRNDFEAFLSTIPLLKASLAESINMAMYLRVYTGMSEFESIIGDYDKIRKTILSIERDNFNKLASKIYSLDSAQKIFYKKIKIPKTKDYSFVGLMKLCNALEAQTEKVVGKLDRSSNDSEIESNYREILNELIYTRLIISSIDVSEMYQAALVLSYSGANNTLIIGFYQGIRLEETEWMDIGIIGAEKRVSIMDVLYQNLEREKKRFE